MGERKREGVGSPLYLQLEERILPGGDPRSPEHEAQGIGEEEAGLWNGTEEPQPLGPTLPTHTPSLARHLRTRTTGTA